MRTCLTFAMYDGLVAANSVMHRLWKEKATFGQTSTILQNFVIRSGFVIKYLWSM